MKVTVNSYQAVALWRWNLKPPHVVKSQAQAGGGPAGAASGADDGAESESEDDEDDVCGICRVAYDGCCPDCKTPGDGCPLIWGECSHVFHMHCLLKWINTESSKQQCPMDRRPWVTVGDEVPGMPPPLPAQSQTALSP